MRVTIDPGACQGHGLCIDAAPGAFAMNAIEHAEPVGTEVPEALQDAVRRAALSCPEAAITIHP